VRNLERIVGRVFEGAYRVTRVCLTWGFVVGGLPHDGGSHEPRLWRDQSGQYEVHGRFVGLEGAIVLLDVQPTANESPRWSPGEEAASYEPSRLVRVPCERLAMEDQQYVAARTVPPSIDAQTVTLELRETEQRIRVPLGPLPSSWDYEAVLERVTVGKESLDLRALHAAELHVPEPVRRVRTATLRGPGHFPVPVEFEGGMGDVRMAVHLRQFPDALVLAFRPTIRLGNKTFEFALRPLARDELALRRSIWLDQQKLAIAQRDLKALPLEIQRTQKAIQPISAPGAQFHNSQISHRLQQLETGLQRAQRNFRSATRALPLEAARRHQLEFLYKVVERYAGQVEAEFLIQRRCGELTQPVVAAHSGGRIALGPDLPLLDPSGEERK
jgi:hypothetical protein